ncbi:hypothetical protein LZ554_006053 [Drepanopeziza brunnea f. sp. 'monogermtubi']|nr:hypothetical protein LZ554_006053 [Drepanopeziza brunnea f. sp. 'monogermtubi']
MKMEQTTARLRKTFRYPTDNDSEDETPDAMDEEEQESLIQSLKEENQKRNQQYTTALLIISLFCCTPYLSTIFSAPTTLLSVLSITSLLSTAYMIHTSPPGQTGLAFVDRVNTEPQSMAARRNSLLAANGGPIKQFLPYLNVGLCVILLGLGSMVQRKGVAVWAGFAWLPAAVYGVAVAGKWVIGGVDPGDLANLRYELREVRPASWQHGQSSALGKCSSSSPLSSTSISPITSSQATSIMQFSLAVLVGLVAVAYGGEINCSCTGSAYLSINCCPESAQWNGYECVLKGNPQQDYVDCCAPAKWGANCRDT